MKKLTVLLVAAALMLSTGAALAQGTFSVPFSQVGGSGVEGSGVLTATGEGTDVSLEITGLAAGSTATATLHAGTCAAPGASFAKLADLTADASGRATASGQVLFRGADPVALQDIADGQHIIAISQSGKMVSCTWIPVTEQIGPAGMPRTGGGGLLLMVAALGFVGVVILGGGLALQRQH